MKLTIAKFIRASDSRALALELLSLSLLSLFCRLPFFFESVIDWDESTFILVGQSIIDGHLPYTKLWELKPPFAFGFYAIAILLFGKTIAAVRFAGTLVVACTAFFVNRTTQRLSTVRAGRLSGVLAVLLMSLLPSGQSVMSEHIAILPMILTLYLLVRQGITTATVFYSGLLLSLAAMVRLNIAYVVIVIGLYLLTAGLRQPISKQILRGLVYSIGAIIPIFLSFLPYWVTGLPQVWWNSVVVASLHRADIVSKGAEVSPSFWDGLIDKAFGIYGSGVQILLGLGAIAAVIALAKQRIRMQPHQILGWSLTIVFIWTLQFSSLSTGSAHLHHLIHLVPFVAPLTAVLVDTVVKKQWQFIAVVLALCLYAAPIFDQYAIVLPKVLTGSQLDPDPARQIANYFIDNGLEDRSIYAMNDHIIYWYINAYPLTLSTTHPSTIGKDYLLQILHTPDWSSYKEMERLFAIEPEFVIKRDCLFYLQQQPKTSEILAAAIAQHYTLVYSVNDINIYRRI